MKRLHWVAAAVILILLVAVVFAPVPGDTRWIRTLHNSAHAPIFGCVSLLTLVILRAHERWVSFGLVRQYATALAAALALGIVTELLQIPVGRDASVEDALHDVVGALAFLGIFAAIDMQVRQLARARLVRIAAAVIGLTASALATAPVIRAAIKYQQRDERFPVLADFSRRYDRYFILQRAADFSPLTVPAPWSARAGEAAMRVRLFDGDYPGMEFIELRPDWSAYATLAIDLTNPTPQNLRLVLRVHDAAHNNRPEDRYSRRIELPPGTRQVIRIPLQDIAAGPQTRTLDLHRVAGIILFRAEDSPPAGEMYFSRAWLE